MRWPTPQGVATPANHLFDIRAAEGRDMAGVLCSATVRARRICMPACVTGVTGIHMLKRLTPAAQTCRVYQFTESPP